MRFPVEPRRSGLRVWRYPVAVFALALLLPGRALAQRGPRFLTDTLPPGDPIEILLARGEELRLTSAQVARLKEIQRALHVANDPLVARLVAIRHEVRGRGSVHPRDMTPEERAGFRAATQRARPLMQAIGRNNVQAMEEVGSALSDQQKSIVRAWLPHAPGSPQGRGPHPRGGDGARGRGGPRAGDGAPSPGPTP